MVGTPGKNYANRKVSLRVFFTWPQPFDTHGLSGVEALLAMKLETAGRRLESFAWMSICGSGRKIGMSSEHGPIRARPLADSFFLVTASNRELFVFADVMVHCAQFDPPGGGRYPKQ
jgi:hypothetical protein